MAKKLDFSVDDVKKALAQYEEKKKKIVDDIMDDINKYIQGALEKIAKNGPRELAINEECTKMQIAVHQVGAEVESALGYSYSLKELVSAINIRLEGTGFKANVKGECNIAVWVDLTAK